MCVLCEITLSLGVELHINPTKKYILEGPARHAAGPLRRTEADTRRESFFLFHVALQM